MILSKDFNEYSGVMLKKQRMRMKVHPRRSNCVAFSSGNLFLRKLARFEECEIEDVIKIISLFILFSRNI